MNIVTKAPVRGEGECAELKAVESLALCRYNRSFNQCCMFYCKLFWFLFIVYAVNAVPQFVFRVGGAGTGVGLHSRANMKAISYSVQTRFCSMRPFLAKLQGLATWQVAGSGSGFVMLTIILCVDKTFAFCSFAS